MDRVLAALHPTHLAGAAKAMGAGIRNHALVNCLAFTVYVVAGLQAMWLGISFDSDLVSLVSGTTLLFLACFILIWLMAEFVRLIWVGHQGSALAALRDKLFEDILAPSRIANTVNAFVANGVFFIGFLAVKKAIPLTVAFSWDESFMRLDRALGFGALPHELLAPILQYPLASFVLNLFYNAWFVILISLFFWQGFARHDSILRQQYLLSYLLTWTLGTLILGTMFSSAGPCYYGFVVAGPDPYAPLLDYLSTANESYPIYAVPTQALLWQSHLAGHGTVEGVSAMPSMHVATTILFVKLAQAKGKRWLTWPLAVFSALIFLGSIMLAWHYAVDGLAGIAIALGCWRLARMLLEWDIRKRSLNYRPS
jgi:PAP2 superfamily